MNLVLLNGPPRAGKDTVAEYLEQHCDYTRFAFAAPLYASISALLGISPAELGAYKDRELAPGTRSRDLMIELSEDIVKPRLGCDWFGVRCAERILESWSKRVVISDCGFEYEVEACLERLRRERGVRALLLRIHRSDCSFERDSRSWIELPEGVSDAHLHNDSTVEDLCHQAYSITRDFFSRTSE